VSTLLYSDNVQRRFLAEADAPAWTEIGPGRRLSASLRTPDGILAPMTYENTRTWAYQHACRLPTRAEALGMAALPHIPVQSMPYSDPDFATVEGAKRYTARVDYQIRARHGEPQDTELVVERPVIVDNESKVWIRDPRAVVPGRAIVGLPSPGWALLAGFFDDAGKPANTGAGAPGKRGYGPGGEPHNSAHVDYSMAPRLVVCDHDVKRAELVTLALALCGPKGERAPTGREVADYFRLGTRDGKRTGYATGWDWCAAGACWLGAEVGLGLGVHEWRIAVWELVADARASWRWRDAGVGTPLPGDLLCFKRGSGDPRNPGELGHVETYIGAPEGADAAREGRSCSANSPGWKLKTGRLASPDYVGYVAR
jgi:hypothetical protein